MTNFGYIKSTLDGTEYDYTPNKSLAIPDSYSYLGNLPKVIDQGAYSICVPCSVSAFLNWREGIKDGDTKDIDVRLFDIYDSKTTEGEGMTFKDALHYLKHHGVRTDLGNTKIQSYAMVKSNRGLRCAIFENGPCIAALPVYGEDYGYNPEFWKKTNGTLQGGHAIAVVGYTPEGFIIRNSWGRAFGENGYTLLKNEDFRYFMEVWTIVA